MFKRFKTNIAAQRIMDEQLYAYVYDEMESGDIRRGIWAKATADAEGTEGKAEALYIKYRVQSIKDEDIVLDRILTEINENKMRNEVSIQSPVIKDKKPPVKTEKKVTVEKPSVVAKKKVAVEKPPTVEEKKNELNPQPYKRQVKDPKAIEELSNLQKRIAAAQSKRLP